MKSKMDSVECLIELEDLNNMKIYIIQEHYAVEGVERLIEADAIRKGSAYEISNPVNLMSGYPVNISTLVPAHRAHTNFQDALIEALKIQQRAVDHAESDLNRMKRELKQLVVLG